MKRALFLLPLVALTACGTPQERCIRSVNSEARTMDRLIAEAQTNISRGYALETRQEVVTVERTCTRTLTNGEKIRFPCNEVETRDYQVPKSIDLNAERAKLASLVERRNQMQPGIDAAVQQCVVNNPE